MVEIFSINGIDNIIIANVLEETEKYIIINKLISVNINYNEKEQLLEFEMFNYFSNLLYYINEITNYKLYKCNIVIRSIITQKLESEYIVQYEQLKEFEKQSSEELNDN